MLDFPRRFLVWADVLGVPARGPRFWVFGRRALEPAGEVPRTSWRRRVQGPRTCGCRAREPAGRCPKNLVWWWWWVGGRGGGGTPLAAVLAVMVPLGPWTGRGLRAPLYQTHLVAASINTGLVRSPGFCLAAIRRPGLGNLAAMKRSGNSSINTLGMRPGFISGRVRWPCITPGHCAFCRLLGLSLAVWACLRAIALPFGLGL